MGNLSAVRRQAFWQKGAKSRVRFFEGSTGPNERGIPPSYRHGIKEILVMFFCCLFLVFFLFCSFFFNDRAGMTVQLRWAYES